MSERHLVVGAGAVGRNVAQELADRGSEVVLVSRSGTGPELAGVRREAADVADPERLSELAHGATAVYNCINPPSYDVWSTYWPPIAKAFLQAAERSGAVLAVAASLYPYGRVDGPMVEGMPDAPLGAKSQLRADMWAEAEKLHDAGRIRTVEVRGSDYMGPGVAMGHIAQVMPRALKGKPVRVFGSADQPHSWTDVRDMGRALVALAADESTWGRVWHAPTNEPRTQAEAVADSCRAIGHAPVRVRAYPRALLSVGGIVVPILREMRETVHQFERPYVLDSTAIQDRLGLKPTPWDEVCRATAASALEG
jgi:nucleoside-diphosphate-sugar epimerase